MAPSVVFNDGNIAVDPNTPAKPTSAARQSSVLHRSIHKQPKKVVHASGNYVTFEDGQELLDATGGAAVACIGHSDPRVRDAMVAQMNRVSYCNSMFFSSVSGEDIAEILVDSTGGKMSKALILSSGSEAMEAALKMARQYFQELDPPQPQRYHFIARRESYHGNTLGALAVSGHVARRALYTPILSGNCSHVSACNAYRGMHDGESVDSYVGRLAQELEDEFQRIGPGKVCAFVAEPVVGVALGCVPAVPGYFPAMKAVCDRHGALLILDEVMSGMGRVGSLHAWEQEGVVPDLQTIAKGLGGGYAPIGGLLVGSKVVDVLNRGTGAFMHGQTYQGHALACAAAVEVQRIIKEENLLKNVQVMGALLEKSLKARLSPHVHVGDIRGKGLFMGIEFVKDKKTKEPFDPKIGVAMGVHDLGMETAYSVSLYPGTGSVDGKRGDHVLVCPSYRVTPEDIEEIVDRVGRVVEDYFESL